MGSLRVKKENQKEEGKERKISFSLNTAARFDCTEIGNQRED